MREAGLGTLTLGRGPAKIVVPLVGNDRTVLRVELDALLDNVADLVKWRTDCLMSFPDTGILLVLARELKQSLGSLPPFTTFQSLPEGGRPPFDAAAYRKFRLRFTKEQLPDLLGVGLFSGPSGPVTYIATLQRERILTVASRHFSDGAPAP